MGSNLPSKATNSLDQSRSGLLRVGRSNAPRTLVPRSLLVLPSPRCVCWLPAATRCTPRLDVTGTLKGHRRRQVLAHHRASGAPCHICGLPIDLSLDPQRHPLAFCVDEDPPRKYGGDPLSLDDTNPSHRLCNGMRGTAPITNDLRQRCRDAVLKSSSSATVRPW